MIFTVLSFSDNVSNKTISDMIYLLGDNEHTMMVQSKHKESILISDKVKAVNERVAIRQIAAPSLEKIQSEFYIPDLVTCLCKSDIVFIIKDLEEINKENMLIYNNSLKTCSLRNTTIIEIYNRIE